MATYIELRQLYVDTDLLDKVEIAVVIAANNLITGTETTADKAWISQVLGSPRGEAEKALKIVLAKNAGATVETIQGASDSAIQTNVNTIVPILVDALAGV
jgi:hypothetical protein